jgi:hypothetical protein
MLEKGTSTCTLFSHLHLYVFLASCTRLPKKSQQGEILGS